MGVFSSFPANIDTNVRSRYIIGEDWKKMLNCIIVGLGGFIGAVLRYLIGLLPVNPQNGFPIKTLFINIIGAFVIGMVVALGARKNWNAQFILFLKVGICGGFTTFSSFALETNQLIERGAGWSAACYVVCSVVGAVAAVFAAQLICASYPR